MRTLPVVRVFVLLFLTSTLASAQILNAADEERNIRKSLGLPDTVPISLARRPRLPPSPLRVHVAVGFDTEMRDFYLSEISQWNREQAKKYERIGMVDTLVDANLIVLRYELLDQVRTEQRTETEEVTVPDPNSSTGYRVEFVERTRTVRIVPVFEYLLGRVGGGYEILSRHLDFKQPGGPQTTRVWEDLQRMLGHDPSHRPWWQRL